MSIFTKKGFHRFPVKDPFDSWGNFYIHPNGCLIAHTERHDLTFFFNGVFDEKRITSTGVSEERVDSILRTWSTLKFLTSHLCADRRNGNVIELNEKSTLEVIVGPDFKVKGFALCGDDPRTFHKFAAALEAVEREH